MTLGQKIAWDDTILPFQLDASDIRGRVARLDGVLDRVLEQHDYPAPIESLVAEMALLTAMIGQTIKLRWKLSLQVRGDGPARLMGWQDRGRIEDGLSADLVIVERESHRIQGVLAQGRVAYLAGGLAARMVG